MSDVEKLRALIADLEQATEGSREADWRLYDIVGTTVPFDPDPRCWARKSQSGKVCPARRGYGSNDCYLPFYTTSLDAALTLVPEDGRVFLDTMTPRDWHGGSAKGKRRAPSAAIESAKLRDSYFGEGESLALALCIAALKARVPAEDDGK